MTQRIILIVSILLVLFYSSCSPDETDHINPHSVSLTKVDSVVLGNSEPLFGNFVEQFRINDAGDIWIFAERNQNRIFAFDSLGQFINVVGERGKGPKGIMHVSGFEINNKNQVIINDAAQKMLKIFNLSGELIQSNTIFSEGELWAHPYSLYNFKDRLLISVTESKFIREPHKSKLLAIVDYEGKIDTVFGKHDIFTSEDNSYSAENTILVGSNTIFTSSVGSPYIQAYNSDTYQQTDYFGGNSSFSIPSKEIHANLPISEINKRADDSSVMAGLYGTEHFIVSHMQVLTAEFFETTDFTKKKNILILYDRKTKKFIKEILVSHTLAAVQNDKLYFIEDFNADNYTIGVYEIVTDQK
ncbi:MAG: 6-bladed beta-propeller [Gracilimonas sp.]|uniref:6-bladed beta-propeller n=1 Tax=Gracilimonas sp. TaxID=1974203 RepID=UPI0019AC67FA|nr:6-bladed beta-propeller [Gracilimonas sp.]MBD3615535.1 6-bladed beta-propeller [Gracilimonas sp.]